MREIKLLFPRLRVIFLARDMVERSWSAILMELRNSVRGIEAGRFAENDAVGEEANPANYKDDYFMERLEHSVHASRTDYATGMRTWLDHFPKEQLLIIDYKMMESDPKELVEQVCRHVGVDTSPLLENLVPGHLSARVNAVSNDMKFPIRPSLKRKMSKFVEPFKQDFNLLLKELDYDWSME